MQALESIDRALALWRGEDAAWRIRLANAHALYSAEVIDLGIRASTALWTRDALAGLCTRELSQRMVAPRSTAVWLAGSIPTATFSAVLLPLLTGASVYVKMASGDQISATLLKASIDAVDAELGARIQLGNDVAMLEQCDAVVAHGSDPTIRAIRERVPPSAVFIGHGHKFSIAALGRRTDVGDISRAIATDIAMYDGRGCLSPACVITEGVDTARALMNALGVELERLCVELPRGTWSADELSWIHQWRERLDLLGIDNLRSADSVDWTISIEEPTPALRLGILRQIPILPCENVETASAWLQQQRPQLSTAALSGWDEMQSHLLEAGCARICDAGQMQFPPIDWHHDGMPPLRKLLRFADDERRKTQ